MSRILNFQHPSCLFLYQERLCSGAEVLKVNNNLKALHQNLMSKCLNLYLNVLSEKITFSILL